MKIAIILGNRMNDDGSLSDLCKKRVEMAIEVYERFKVDKIILSGGIPNKKAGVSEADEMFKSLVEKGMDKAVLLKESNSLTTVENAKFAVPMAVNLGADTILLVSSIEHISRSYFNPIRIFQKKLLEYPSITLEVFTK